MFNVSHHGRKYAPVRFSDQGDSPSPLPASPKQAPETPWSPPGAKLRIPRAGKGAAHLKAVRPHTAPLPASLESLQAAWSGKGHRECSPSCDGRSGSEGRGGGPPRVKKKGFRPPDVRTIFSPGEKDPRVREEYGEGHTFVAGGEDTWCDFCCRYILQCGVTCAGESGGLSAGPGGGGDPCSGCQTLVCWVYITLRYMSFYNNNILYIIFGCRNHFWHSTHF